MNYTYTVTYRVIYANDHLEHHGILGQKWGVRRFQNPDGSYTAAGRKRYGINYKPKSLFKDNNSKSYRSITTMVLDNAIDKTFKNRNRSQSDKDYYDRTKDSGYKDVAKRVAATAAVSNLNPISIAATLADITVGQAIASVKTKKIEKANSAGEVDPKTGFHMKEDREYSRKEDMRAVNPGFKNFNDNTKNNCMLCTMTYDLRKRGYAVSANKTTSGYMENDLARWYPDAKVNKVNNTNEKGKKSRIALVKNAISDMESLGPGARGNLMVRFSQSRLVDIPAGGHSMAFEVNEKGKLQILDCQTNKIYTNPSPILSRCYDINYARLDNIDIDTTHIKEVAH